jgi:hypothetical protein
MVFLGSTPIGGPIIGYVSEHLGARWGIGAGALATILTAVYGFGAMRRSARAIPVDEGTEVAAVDEAVAS